MAAASFGDIWFRCCLDRQGCNVVLFLLREEVADWSAVNGLEIFVCNRNFIIWAMAVSTPMPYLCFRTHVGSSQRWGHTRVWAGRATVQDIRGQAEFDGYYYNQFLVVIIYIASDPLSFGLLLRIVYLFACGIYALCSRSSSIIEYYSRYFLQFFSQWIAHLQLLKTFLFFKRDECLHFGI